MQTPTRMTLGAVGLAVAVLIAWVVATVPPITAVTRYEPTAPLRIHSVDGRLIGQFGGEYRLPRPMSAIPADLRRAFLAAEDAEFHDHPGIDLTGILRALAADIRAGAFVQGGSTISQQVARTFLLSQDQTLMRKIRETVLAFEIEIGLSKQEILHRYLNQLYLGSGAYGVAAAAQTYYGKSLDELTLAESATLASLPKGPSHYNPIQHPDRARHRRAYVLHQMLDKGWAGPDAVLEALATPIHATYHPPVAEPLPMVAESARRRIVARFGEERAYTEGLRAVVTVDSRLQDTAQRAVQRGLLDYTRRHGYRGPLRHIGLDSLEDREGMAQRLKQWQAPGPLATGLVLGYGDNRGIRVLLPDAGEVRVPWQGLRWARSHREPGVLGPQPEDPRDIVRPGDVVRLQRTDDHWTLAQVPEAQGALVALAPDTGAIRALVGAFGPYQGSFNRATQARRQPGSAFKPFIYAGALARGLSPATLVNDAPVVRPGDTGLWRPRNHSRTFHGPTRLRSGLVHSRNLATVRLLDRIGVEYGRDFAAQFGLERHRLPDDLSLALGSASLAPVELVGAYAAFANGGYRVEPYLIRRLVACDGEELVDRGPRFGFEAETDRAPGERILPRTIQFQMTSLLADVTERGTGQAVGRALDRRVAGKTGTTDDQRDAWFVGYTPQLATGAWVGFDRSRSLGRYETGARAAAPIWTDFMAGALAGHRPAWYEPPSGLIRARIHPDTGQLASADEPEARHEWLRAENLPEDVLEDGVLTREPGEDRDRRSGPNREVGNLF